MGEYSYLPPEGMGETLVYAPGRDTRILAAYDVTPWPEHVNGALVGLAARCEALERRIAVLEMRLSAAESDAGGHWEISQ